MASHPVTISFETQAPGVLGELRSALARVLAASGTPIRRPRHVQDAFNIHQTLAWKIYRVAHGPDLLADGQFVPGRPGFESFIAAARERGVPAERLAAVQQAYDNYRSLVESQAGDRPSMDLMLQGMLPEAPASPALKARRPGFRAASSIWGVQVRTRLLCQIVAPSAERGRVDLGVVRGSLGMRRVRPDARLSIGPAMVVDNGGRGRIEALFPEDVTAGAPLLKKYCSQPLPPTTVGLNPRGLPEHVLGEAPLGGKSGMSIYFGEVHRAAASAYQEPHNPFVNTAQTVRLPMECAVIDVWMHESLTPPGSRPRTFYYGESSGVPWYEQLPEHAERLEMAERAQTIGAGLSASPLVGVPEYQDIMTETFARVGWDADEFVLHRLRVEYPAIATAMVLQVDLPAPP
ncbi:MAG: hypothetical protein QM783_01910 [Phycisphaerales bacterium]